MAYSKKSDDSPRMTRLMHRDKSQLSLLSNRMPTNVVYHSVATIRWKVMILLSVAVLVYQKRSRGHQKRSGRGRKMARRKPINYNTRYRGGGDSDSNNEDLHHVKFKKCLTTSMVNFSTYSLCDNNSLSSPNNPEARAYSARTAATSPTIIIDFGTTSYIHSDHGDFTSLKSSSSGFINGFREGSRTIEGCSE